MPPEATTGYRVEVVRGIDSVPGQVWDALAPPDDPMWSRGLFAAMERGAIGPDGYAYLLVRDGGEVVAGLPLCLFRQLRLDQVIGPRERRLLGPVLRLCPSVLRVPMVICGNILGQGHLLSAKRPPDEVCRLLVSAVRDFAARERVGTVVFKDFIVTGLDPVRAALTDAGYFFMPSMPDTELRLGYRSFEEYVSSLPAKPRRNTRAKMRKFECYPGLRIEVLADFGHLLPAVLALYRQVMDRADQTLDTLDESFLAALESSPRPRRRLVACFEGDRLIAFLLCLFKGTGATGARIGLDYRLAYEARLYHNMHYAAIRLAIESGCTHIRFAQTAYAPKVEFGCALIAQSHAVTHLRPLPRAVLRRLLPPALSAALKRSLGPHASLLTPQSLLPTGSPEERSAHATS
jgi:predicted N-acyltransferase